MSAVRFSSAWMMLMNKSDLPVKCLYKEPVVTPAAVARSAKPLALKPFCFACCPLALSSFSLACSLYSALYRIRVFQKFKLTSFDRLT